MNSLVAGNQLLAHAGRNGFFIIPIISTEVARLEQEQVQLGAGMTVAGSEVAKSEIRRMAAGNHVDSGLAMEAEPD